LVSDFRGIGEASRILELAREAAASMRRAAREEAQRALAEAEAYASETRAAADAFAEERRSEAERQAVEILARLALAEKELESSRRQRDLIDAEMKRSEERLRDVLSACKAMRDELERLVAARVETAETTPDSE
jgi:colicin import membrane protein